MAAPSIVDTARVAYSRILSPRVYRLRLRLFRILMTQEKLLRKFPADVRQPDRFISFFKQKLRERFFLSDLNRKEFYVNLMTSLGGFDSIMDDADMVHENKFRTLGSEVYSFGEKVDWHLDFKNGKRWDRKLYTEIDTLALGDPSNIKVPWEVSRFHQAIWLGKAYWISRSEAHTDKFKELVEDWIEQNPVGSGVNWSMTMEAAIRAMNLIVGLLYFMGSSRLDSEFLLELLCSLYDHGVFIRHNLERTLNSKNHLVSNLVALLYLGILFYDTRAGRSWARFAWKELEREITRQVYDDGTDFEKSISYHRMVLEMFTSAYVLMKLNGFAVSNAFSKRLESMHAFLGAATMRDGRTPNIGDADDGRIFRMRMNIDFNDHRDLLAAGAALFGRKDMKAAAGGFSELALLLLGGEGFEKFEGIAPDNPATSKIFTNGGFAFMRTEKDFCSFDFGDIGMRGSSGHGHNDVLAFTIAGRNQFIVDRGTYCYATNVSIRNKLRSTYSHNTVVVDGTEQAEFAGVWSVKRDSSFPELLEWQSTEEQDVVEAQHHAYERLVSPVTHRRGITFNKRQRTLRVQDELIGTGPHNIEMMFHFAPGLKVVQLDRNFLALEGEEYALMKFQHPFTLEDWEHSPSFGVIQTAKTARVKLEASLPLTVETFIFITGSADDMNYLLNRIQSKGSTQ